MKKNNSLKHRVISAITAGVIFGTSMGSMPLSVQASEKFEIRDGYTHYNNCNDLPNVDIDDPAIYQRFLEGRFANNNLPYDQNQLNPNMPNQYYEEPQYNNYYEVPKLYTLVKYGYDGNPVYAYSAVKDVYMFGFSGWTYNSDYNANDYDLNSVFFEEKYMFGNNYDWDANLMELINQYSKLYVWRYSDSYGETKYCLSPIKEPNTGAFVYNSDYNAYNDLTNLKSAESVYNRGLVRTR